MSGKPDSGAEPRRQVLIVALFYPPDNYTGAARPHRFSKYLQKLGYDVKVLAGTAGRKPVLTENVYRLHACFDYLPKDSLVEKIFRRFLLPHDEGFTWSLRIVPFARRWRNPGRQPVVLSTAPPFTTHLAGLAMKRLYGWKWIADFRDPLTDNPYRYRGARSVDGLIEKTFFRHADALIANTDTVAERWRERYPQAGPRIHCLWNGFDPEEALGPAPIPNRCRKILRHVGSIYGDRYPEMLLKSVERLIAAGRSNPDTFRIDLIGPGQFPEGMRSVPWLHCLPKQVPKSEANRLLMEADSLLLLDVTTSGTGLQVPAKIFDYIRIGRPVLACTLRGSPVDRILTQSGIPYVGLYAGDPPDEIDCRVERFLTLPNTPLASSEWFRQNFNGRLQAEALARIIDSL